MRMVKIIADEVEKLNDRYPHFKLNIKHGYICRTVVKYIGKDRYKIYFVFHLFAIGSLALQGIL